jgi:hypothetical protein
MSIDGVGRPPRPSGDAGVSGSKPVAGTETFSTGRAAAAPGVTATGPLADLQSGAITLDQYLNTRVEEAVAPFVEKLSPERLEFMRTSLKAELATDPVLVELVRRATGATPASEP